MNRLYYVWFICLVLTSSILAFGSKPKKMKLEVYNYMNCPGEKHLTVQLVDPEFVKDPETDALFVSGTFVTNVTFDEKTINVITIKKCSTEQDSSCFKYLDYKLDNMCDMMWKKNTTTYDFVKEIQGMEEKCPIKPGAYKLDEIEIKTDGLFPSNGLLEGHWRMQYTAKVDGKLAACLIVSAEMKIVWK